MVKVTYTERVKMHAESSFEVTEEILDPFVPDVTDFVLKVLWRGFEAIEASREPLKKLMKEYPAVFMKYVKGVKNADDYPELEKAIKQASKKR
ncbi:hypothetical protein H310_02784 [Aphanomyces invadans]|uniref:Uncharacterized protein n=1 Tax=Aphanomyces invadans TaxID=157072 RepID=A0A024UL34_9STRA|nr:hypothetical protein H310_02784 [Aphanomyces invadans]ETW06567.1 hypothetical protein H310_02784 [Aphanomyces invadans]|eukprot:XP_008864642.1 hypothetical protein H310_02784 [Aphanomyces invadans]